ncbi:MAG TPA: tetratricopeptide repeat protein [Gaiellaceae bacterium]|jgi:tetratricopeptide (TPR) repeat protein|nr:tetratricopeptide repeat protein [Gaiellaceae bacterium]
MAIEISRSDHAAGSAHSRPGSSRLGDRLRQLRVAAGLTQSDLAGDRFSKEYISQIERGKTRPTPETVEWLAVRLGSDVTFLASGVSSDEQAHAEAVLARAEALVEKLDFAGAIDEYAGALGPVVASGASELRVRLLSGEAWARMQNGEVRTGLDLLAEARGLAEGPEFSDVERGDILFRLGVARYLISSIATAVAIFGEALALLDQCELPSDLLRSKVLTWRSRCYRRQRDYEAAREDIERALELAEGLQDTAALGEAYFQASLVAERDGHWVLARTYAERAKTQYEELADRSNVGRLLNNLGGLEFLLGKPEQAIERLQEAFAVALDHGTDDDVATIVSSLAQVNLKTGDPVAAEEHARHALRLLDGREDRVDEIGNAQLVLGRALLDRELLDEAEAALADAEQTLSQLSSGPHRAAAWIAQGDLATRRGDDRQAAGLYRQAAEALQDFRF